MVRPSGERALPLLDVHNVELSSGFILVLMTYSLIIGRQRRIPKRRCDMPSPMADGRHFHYEAVTPLRQGSPRVITSSDHLFVVLLGLSSRSESGLPIDLDASGGCPSAVMTCLIRLWLMNATRPHCEAITPL